MELKHGYYHLIAILVVAIWGLTFISTKVLINHGLTPQEIFFYRFLIVFFSHGNLPNSVSVNDS